MRPKCGNLPHQGRSGPCPGWLACRPQRELLACPWRTCLPCPMSSPARLVRPAIGRFLAEPCHRISRAGILLRTLSSRFTALIGGHTVVLSGWQSKCPQIRRRVWRYRPCGSVSDRSQRPRTFIFWEAPGLRNVREFSPAKSGQVGDSLQFTRTEEDEH